MDDDGFTLNTRRRRGTTREPAHDRGRDAFLREVPKYSGTPDDYGRAHARTYGKEEGLGPDGKHHHGSGHFPRGSERQRMHTQYSKSTKPRDASRDAYNNGLTAAERDFDRLDDDEREYYRTHTGGLPPSQHERLDPHAKEYRDRCLDNARNRDIFLRKHPYGYHDAQAQQKHHDHASNAYGEYEYARDRQQLHEKHRSFSNIDPRRDQWGRPMAHR